MIISTVVYAAPVGSGRYEQLQRRGGRWYARTVDLYTHGAPQRSVWQQVDNDEAARILVRADGPVPASWQRVLT